jgi:predicted dithiol-disulfide oxidoreductase (DUF899 family)
MQPTKVVSHEDWIAARKAHLAAEKDFSRARDALAAARRELPWELVDKDYSFEGPDGTETLADLFAGKSQLIVYHFMLGPGWDEGCPSCSYLADHFDGAMYHLPHRDVTMVVVSRAPYAEIQKYQKRMGWTFKWVSSAGSDFNFDYQASARPEEVEKNQVYYNYTVDSFPSDEMPGLSVFAKGDDGKVYHTYSSYGRGLDMFIGAYHFLDTVPKGRDEANLDWSMQWVRRHDSYD